MDDAFVTAFFNIDTSKVGKITISQLRKYQNDNNYDEGFVQKWMKLFDRRNTGVITLEEFCDVLGLEITEVRRKQAEFVVVGSFPSDVTVIVQDLELQRQLRIIEITREGYRKYDKYKDVAKYIKQVCDKEFKQLWHVVIVKGQYWSYYSYDPGYNFVFKLGTQIHLVWRTPMPE